MKTSSNLISMITFSLLLYYHCTKNPITPYNGKDPVNGKKEHPYLDQFPPGTIPERFAPQIMQAGVLGITFSPDGLECFFNVMQSDAVIKTTRESNGVWPTPETAPFSGTFEDLEPHITPDGNRLYFRSRRPLDGVMPTFLQMWYLDKTNAGWSEPKPIDPPFRELFIFYPSVATSGNMYFTTNDGNNQWICISRYINSHYQEPEVFIQNVNSGSHPGHPFIDQTKVISLSMPSPADSIFVIYTSDFGIRMKHGLNTSRWALKSTPREMKSQLSFHEMGNICFFRDQQLEDRLIFIG